MAANSAGASDQQPSPLGVGPSARPRRGPQRRTWLRIGDQWALALLVGLGLIATAVYWGLHHRGDRQLVDIDRAGRLSARFEVDVNTAGWPELLQLPGVGPTLAKRIVARRQAGGPFAAAAELTSVDGIGPKTLARIRPYLAPFPAQP